MFSFLSNLLAKLGAVTAVTSTTASVASQKATTVLNLAALAAPQHAEAINALSAKVLKDTAAAQSLLTMASHVAVAQPSALASYGIDAVSALEPQYAPFLQAAKPIILASGPLLEALAASVSKHLETAASDRSAFPTEKDFQ